MTTFKRITTPTARPAVKSGDDALRATFAAAHAAGMQAANDLGPANDMRLAMSCGFAWVNLKPTRSRAAKLFAEMGDAGAFAGRVKHSDYYHAMQLWVSAFLQSEPHKSAYAYAFADTLRAAGLDASAGSRLD